MSKRLVALVIAASSAMAAPSSASAQGTVGSQGLGYPTGGISTRSRAMGTSAAELDPLSAVNPASMAEGNRAILYMQYEPEFRRVTGAGTSPRLTVIRFPVFSGALPVGSRGMLGLSASTLLDRSWATRDSGSTTVASQSITYIDAYESLGGISDLRIGFAWSFTQAFHAGVGIHGITGQNRLQVTRQFDPTQTAVATFSQTSSVNYRGEAISAGFEWRPLKALWIGGSGLKGGSLRAYAGDTLQRSGRTPDRFGLGARVSLASSAGLFARYNRVNWSNLASLGFGSGSYAAAYDATEFGAGIEGRGPTFLGRPVSLRFGGDHRKLPFYAAGDQPTETAFGGGFGLPIAFGRGTFDAAVQRATRSSGNARESALTLSLGLTLRP